MGQFDLSKWAVKKTVRYYNGKTEIQISDFIDGETCQVSVVNMDGIKEVQKVSFSNDLIDALNAALKEEVLKSAVVFKL